MDGPDTCPVCGEDGRCADGCICVGCEVDRALDESADAYAESCRD